MNVMEFFQQSAGQWHSQRTTHHLPFRRAELGGSNIKVEALHEVDPNTAVGGAYVEWDGAMAWDKDNESH